MEVSESTIEAIADVTTKWGRDEISCEVAMHDIWALFRSDAKLSAKLSVLDEIEKRTKPGIIF